MYTYTYTKKVLAQEDFCLRSVHFGSPVSSKPRPQSAAISVVPSVFCSAEAWQFKAILGL